MDEPLLQYAMRHGIARDHAHTDTFPQLVSVFQDEVNTDVGLSADAQVTAFAKTLSNVRKDFDASIASARLPISEQTLRYLRLTESNHDSPDQKVAP